MSNTFNFQSWWADNGSRFNEPSGAKQVATDLLMAALEPTLPPYDHDKAMALCDQVEADCSKANQDHLEAVERLGKLVRKGIFTPQTINQ